MQNNVENRDWYLIDAKGLVLGRVATQVANLLRGKGKLDFAPNKDTGDFVVITNADKIVMTGKKEEQKRYYKHTSYIGNLKTYTVADLRAKHPEEILRHAVEGMLPKNKLQPVFINRLKLYTTDTHPHLNAKFKELPVELGEK